MSNGKLILDIETVGVDFDALDKATQENLTRWIEKESSGAEEYKVALEELKNGLGFSPLTGEIVAIGLLDYHKNEGVVYYQAPGQKNAELKEGDITFKQMSEKDMLQKFCESRGISLINLRLGSLLKENEKMPGFKFRIGWEEDLSRKVFLSYDDLKKIVNKSTHLDGIHDFVCTSKRSWLIDKNISF